MNKKSEIKKILCHAERSEASEFKILFLDFSIRCGGRSK